MNQYSKYELDRKIHTFMKRKMHEFPELKHENYTTGRIGSKEHDRVHRHQFFPSMRFGTQH